jgi:predicted HNH restriction endonuclease
VNKEQIKTARVKAARVRYRAMNDMANPFCQVCEFAYPPIVHLHHVHPLASTNEDSNETIWLCPNCHAIVHELVRCYYSPRQPRNVWKRLGHLDYWMSDVCPRDIADKLRDIAKRTAKKS